MKKKETPLGSMTKTPKPKSVTLTIDWCHEIHSLTIGPRNWEKIKSGKAWRATGKTFCYQGERMACYWKFNGRGGPGSLIVSYGNDRFEDFAGDWDVVNMIEH